MRRRTTEDYKMKEEDAILSPRRTSRSGSTSLTVENDHGGAPSLDCNNTISSDNSRHTPHLLTPSYTSSFALPSGTSRSSTLPPSMPSTTMPADVSLMGSHIQQQYHILAMDALLRFSRQHESLSQHPNTPLGHSMVARRTPLMCTPLAMDMGLLLSTEHTMRHAADYNMQQQNIDSPSKKRQESAHGVAEDIATSATSGSSESDILENLALTCLQRRMSKEPYVDASHFFPKPSNPASLGKRRTARGGATEPFPEKLYRILEEAAAAGQEDIVSFSSHGRAFGIHRHEAFVEEIMSKYFKHSQLSSFQRQLNIYGFGRVNAGPDGGGYYHELFLRGRPDLCHHIARIGVPQEGVRRKRGVKGHKTTLDPYFYSMPLIQEVTQSIQQSEDGGKSASDG